MTIRNPLVLTNGLTTELQEGDFIPLTAVSGLENNLDSIVDAIANIASAQGSIINSIAPSVSPIQISPVTSILDFDVQTQSTDTSIFELDSTNNLFLIKKNVSVSFLSNVELSSSVLGARTLTFDLIDDSTNNVLISYVNDISIPFNRTESFQLSTLLTVGKNGIPSAPLNVRVEVRCSDNGYTLESFNSLVLVSSGSTGGGDASIDDLTTSLLTTWSSQKISNELSTKASTATATQTANGLLSSSDKTKLDGIASGAEVNQNAFSNIVIGATTISADNKTDTLNLVAGTNISLVANSATDTITINANDTSVDWSEVQNKPDPVITLAGDLSGSVTLTDLGSGTLTATIQPNSVVLGTDTTGNYVAGVTQGTDVLVTGTAGEGWSPTISVDSASANTANKLVKRDASGNFSAGTITATLSGNATTATTLQTARTINGVSFDGSANITINAVDSTARQPLDADLTAIAALAGTSGLLKKTATDTWTLDTSAYVTSSGVTSVTGTAPIVSSGGVTPAISISAATTSAAGSMSAADKTKLDGIASGAEVNQNTFSNIAVSGQTTVAADNKTDTVTFVAGSNVTITADAVNDTVTFSATNTTYGVATSTVSGLVELASDTVQTTTANEVTSTSGRTYGSQLNSNGQLVVNVPWTDTNTTYSAGTGLSLVGTTFSNTAPDQTVVLTGSGATSVSGTYPSFTISSTDTVYTHPTSGVTAGTYKSVTVNANGHVTAGTNPTTLAGYGITDAQALDADLTAIAALAGTSGLLRKTDANTWSLDTTAYTANTGTVTSVSLSLPSILTVSGSPVTTSGTLSATLASQTANTVFAAPNGSAGAPTFRTLVATDIPSLDAGKITTGTLAVARGGTGLASYAVGDLVFASGATTLSKLADVATGNVLLSGGVGVAPSYGKVGLTTHVSGTLPVANGGTGVTTSTGSGSVVLSTSPTLTTPNIGVATGTSFNSITGLASVAPLVAGTAAVGTSTLAARQDHVHPAQTSVTGNAGTATKLATARTIAITGDATGTGTSFDGSANISINVTSINGGTY